MGVSPVVPLVAVADLPDAAQLDDHVGALRDLRNALPPRRQHLVVAVGVGTDANQPADVVQHDGQVGNGPGELCQLG